jgi:hypothetical protein
MKRVNIIRYIHLLVLLSFFGMVGSSCNTDKPMFANVRGITVLPNPENRWVMTNIRFLNEDTLFILNSEKDFRAGEFHLYKTNLNHVVWQKVLEDYFIEYYDFSQDRKQVIFVGATVPNIAREFDGLWVADIDSQGTRLITKLYEISRPSWSPSANRLVMTIAGGAVKPSRIEIMEFPSLTRKIVYTEPLEQFGNSEIWETIQIGDSEQYLFTSESYTDKKGTGLFLYDAIAGGVKELVNPNGISISFPRMITEKWAGFVIEDTSYNAQIGFVNIETDCFIKPFKDLIGIWDFDISPSHQKIAIIESTHKFIYLVDVDTYFSKLFDEVLQCN